MPRAKGGVVHARKRKRILKRASGFVGQPGHNYRSALEFTRRADRFAYEHRKIKKRLFRELWITRLNAALKLRGINYSRFIPALLEAGIELNRKMLSEICIADTVAFDGICDRVKPFLKAGNNRPKATPHSRDATHQVVLERPDPPTNWLIDSIRSVKVRLQQSWRAMDYGRQPNASMRQPTDAAASIQPVSMPRVDVQYGVAHALLGDFEQDEVRRLLVERRANEVFLDVGPDASPAEIQSVAIALHHYLNLNCDLWEPVVVGPLPDDMHDLLDALALKQVRTTDEDFATYSASMDDHDTFTDKVLRDRVDRKRSI